MKQAQRAIVRAKKRGAVPVPSPLSIPDGVFDVDAFNIYLSMRSLTDKGHDASEIESMVVAIAKSEEPR